MALFTTDSHNISSPAMRPGMLLVPGEEKGVPIDPSVFRDEERMKRELMAWAKAVASSIMARDLSADRRLFHPS